MDETPAESAPGRPATPSTHEQLRRSLQVIRIAIGVGIATILVLTWAFIALLDAPAVPLIPLAGLVIAVDLAMLVIFTRQRRRAIEALERRESGLPG